LDIPIVFSTETVAIFKGPALVAALAASACLPRPPSAVEQPSPEIVLERVKVWIYRGGQLTATGHAVRSVYDRESGQGAADTVVFHVSPSGRDLGQGGRAAKGVDLDSRRVVGGIRTQVADASGGVAVRTGVGDRAETPTAHFEGAGRTVTGRDGVAVDGPEYHLTAPAFSLYLSDERLELTGGVRAITGEAR